MASTLARTGSSAGAAAGGVAAGAAAGWTTWPAYRVSSGQMWGMQWRLADCFRQQRFPEPIYGSDVTIALSMFMAATANGAIMATPGIKR